MEFHPRIDTSVFPLNENKIILGSFPTWSLTSSNENDDIEKAIVKSGNSDFDFYYGSYLNKFWTWYKLFVDDSIVVNQIGCIKASLRAHGIGITDMIVSCERKGKSSLDKHLIKRTYNDSFLRIPSSYENIRILCTSKGVMNDMLLTKSFYQRHTSLKLDDHGSIEAQRDVLMRVQGDISLVGKPFYQTIQSSEGGKIECFAIPSPGSPFRKLSEFGKCKGDNAEYLNNFLREAFYWLNYRVNFGLGT